MESQVEDGATTARADAITELFKGRAEGLLETFIDRVRQNGPGESEATVRIYAGSGDTVDIPAPFNSQEEKVRRMRRISQHAKELEATGLLFCSEVWFTVNPSKEEIPGPPSADPNRREGVMVTVMGPEVPTIVGTVELLWPLSDDDPLIVKEVKWSDSEVTNLLIPKWW